MRRFYALLFFLTMAAQVVLSQPGGPPGGNGGGDPVGVPLDGGLLSVLLAGGIGLYLSKRKKKQE
jgi:hypothetical protein